MTRTVARYVGNGAGRWSAGTSGIYQYRPSLDDKAIARDFGIRVAAVRNGEGVRGGYWKNERERREARPEWYERGFLGEVAALHPLGAGPDVEVWTGAGWYGQSDYGRIEVRTVGRWQLFGFASARHAKQPGIAGWRVTAKDRGRVIVCVEDRDDDLLVLGWAEADLVPRLAEPLQNVVAVIEPGDLLPLVLLAQYQTREP